MKTTQLTTTIDGLTVTFGGKAFDYHGINLAVHRALDSRPPHQPCPKAGWDVSEVSTGRNVSRGKKTQTDAITDAKERIDFIGINKTKEVIKKTLKRQEQGTP